MAKQTQNDDPAAAIRGLVRKAHLAALATDLSGQEAPNTQPYGSLVQVACDMAGRPILLLSDLAQHTVNIKANPKACLMFDDCRDLGEPLTGPRASVLGTLHSCDDEAVQRRYLSRFPEARDYAGFADFHFYVLDPSRAHFVGGFGQIEWAEGASILLPDSLPDSLAESLDEAESGIVSHMNADHRDALTLYATVFAGASDGDWRMSGIDPEGFDLVNAGTRVRISFAESIRSSGDARAALVGLVEAARGVRAD